MSLKFHWFQNDEPSKSNNKKKTSILVLKRTFFSIVQLWQLIFLEPLRVQRRYVPHFKGLISGNLEPTAQRCDSSFTFRHAL